MLVSQLVAEEGRATTLAQKEPVSDTMEYGHQAHRSDPHFTNGSGCGMDLGRGGVSADRIKS